MNDITTSPLDEFVTWVQGGIEYVRQTFTEPDEDWAGPVLFMERTDGERAVCMMAGLEKEQAIAALPGLLRKEQAFRYALLASAWMVTCPNEDGIPEVMPADHPDRVEVLILTAGDAGSETTYFAEILRDEEQPPALSQWKKMEGKREGRFVDLNDVLREPQP